MAEQTTHTEVGHEPDHGAFPPFKSETYASQLLWLAITFGALYLLMSRVALPRVASVLAQRKDAIGKQLDEAVGMQTQANDAAAAQEKSLADARANAKAMAQAARDKLAADSEASRKTLEAELGAKLAAAETEIAQTTAAAMANVEGIARDAVAAIVERLTGQSPSPEAVAQAMTTAKQA